MISQRIRFVATFVAAAAAFVRGPVTRADTPVTVLHDFSTGGEHDPLSRLVAVGSTLYRTTNQGADGIFSIDTSGQNYQVVHSFAGNSTDGATPEGNLTLIGSTLYGVTAIDGSGGPTTGGTIFSVDPSTPSSYQVLFNFNNSPNTGNTPMAGLTLFGSTLYGTTEKSTIGNGTIFSSSLSGSVSFLHTFNNPTTDGSTPKSPLTLIGGKLYGTTSAGGGGLNDGALISFDPSNNSVQLLHGFQGFGNSDGSDPVAFTSSDLAYSRLRVPEPDRFISQHTTIASFKLAGRQMNESCINMLLF